MQVPLETLFRDVPRSEALERLTRERVDRLHRISDRIVSCRVAVERPHQHPDSGNPHRVRVELRLPPGRNLVVTREPGQGGLHDELPTVIRSAFEAMTRRLRKATEKDSGEVKEHDEPTALVVRLFADQGYGFLKTPEGRELFFHRNAVLHDDFERLEVGTEVRFEPSMGEQGPQASTVQVVNKPGARPTGEATGDVEPPPDWR